MHGDTSKRNNQHKDLLALKETSALLAGGQPHIKIMFTSSKDFSHTKIPGCFSVPVSFNPHHLKEYVTENIHECRQRALDFVA